MAQKVDPSNIITANNTGDFWNSNKYYVGDPPYDPQQGQTAIQPGSYHIGSGLSMPGPQGPPGEPGPAGVIAIEDPHLLDLIEMLELEESSEGLCLQIDGRQYSLVDIMYAQMKFMFRMNVLLIHRQLGRTNED